MSEQRRTEKRRSIQRTQQRQFKYDGLVEYGVDLEIASSEHRVAVAELTGGVR